MKKKRQIGDEYMIPNADIAVDLPSVTQTALLHRLPIRPLKNRICPYCGAVLDAENTTKEHVVGRNFVPKGSLSGCWNLILQCCRDCNSYKSDLENDISAVSMIYGAIDSDSSNVKEEAHRKAAKSVSRRTCLPLSQSNETISLELSPFSNLHVNASMVSPPQVDVSRSIELAYKQVAAFYFLLTYDTEKLEVRSWPGAFVLLSQTPCSDWGNTVQKWFMTTVIEWQTRVLGVMADGFFKIAVRRHPNLEVWSWALEWNHGLRMTGFLGEVATVKDIIVSRPEMKWHTMVHSDGQYTRIRAESRLQADEDLLFATVNRIEPAFG